MIFCHFLKNSALWSNLISKSDSLTHFHSRNVYFYIHCSYIIKKLQCAIPFTISGLILNPLNIYIGLYSYRVRNVTQSFLIIKSKMHILTYFSQKERLISSELIVKFFLHLQLHCSRCATLAVRVQHSMVWIVHACSNSWHVKDAWLIEKRSSPATLTVPVHYWSHLATYL